MPAGDKKEREGEEEKKKTKGKGLKSAEAVRPPGTCPAAEDGAGELEADGGKVTLPPSNPPPPLSSIANAILSPLVRASTAPTLFPRAPSPPPPSTPTIYILCIKQVPLSRATAE